VEISRDAAIIVNRENWQVGEERELNLMFADVRANIRCMVTDTDGHYATVKFLDMPASVYNRLVYGYLTVADK
ncbi:MAG: hypothetical protein IJ218_06215, partial [Alphaproteobacteria bacterium]|nr:hypothetical protein [Alphaproteobacteria bacterium]